MAVLGEGGASTGPRSNSNSTNLSKKRDIEERRRGKREKVEVEKKMAEREPVKG